MKNVIFIITAILLLPAMGICQQVTYSDYEQDNSRDINFEIIGKMNGNFLVYKNLRTRHKINIYDNDMKIKESIKLDFMPDKTFNVDFVTYPNFFYMVYQYQKKNILHCMGVKMDGDGKKLTEPIELDTTQIPFFADNKIYSVIYSEDKHKIMIFKIHKKNESFNIVTMLFNDSLKLIANKTRQALDFDERKDNYDNFLLDNDGNFIFTRDSKTKVWHNDILLSLVIKAAQSDTFAVHEINLDKKYYDEVKLKADNLNNRYILTMLYAKKYKGNIDGLNNYIWDKASNKMYNQNFSIFSDSLRNEAKTSGALKYALDDYFIRQVILKKDGGFIITAEDFTSQGRGLNNGYNNGFNNYPFGSPFASNYYYSPYYGYYRPLSSFNNSGTRYYYSNIMILSINKNGEIEWSQIIHKEQFDDDNDNFLSFCTMNSGGEIHFLFNENNRNEIVANQSLSPSGSITRNPTLKSQERGYQFMTRLSKQVGASQLLIPCIYRGNICFAKIDF